MGDDEYRPSVEEGIEVFHDHLFILDIQGISGLIEKEIRWDFINTADDEDPLDYPPLIPFLGEPILVFIPQRVVEKQ